jgi:predicted enzyme related to lactoylglutathione lyase
MEMKLELVPIPVSDLDRAETFYVEALGFREDVDDATEGVRYAPFRDPDGNSWTLQEMSWRTGDRF